MYIYIYTYIYTYIRVHIYARHLGEDADGDLDGLELVGACLGALGPLARLRNL